MTIQSALTFEPTDDAQHDTRRAAPGFSSQYFRMVLGHFPTGVVVVTATDPAGEPAGLVVGSFTSVSLDPPLVAFLPAKSSISWPRMACAGAFCVNVLGAEQHEHSRVFSRSGGDKFREVSWRPAPSGSPVLESCVAWIDCDLERVDEAGDHLIVLGRVQALGVEDSVEPLVFVRGGYGAAVRSNGAGSW